MRRPRRPEDKGVGASIDRRSLAMRPVLRTSPSRQHEPPRTGRRSLPHPGVSPGAEGSTLRQDEVPADTTRGQERGREGREGRERKREGKNDKSSHPPPKTGKEAEK